MSIFADITTLETKIEKELIKAGKYRSIDNFVQAYHDSILEGLEGFTRGQLTDVNLQQIINNALEGSSDFIDINLSEDIQRSLNQTLSDTADFYEELGIDPIDLVEGIERREEIIQLTDEFRNNMETMREELLDGTLEKMKEVIGKHGLDRSLLEAEIFKFADGRAHWARTNARMVVSSSNRIARDELRESAGLQHGFYYGAKRDTTRAFCSRLIGKTFTLKQINNMSNGQGLEVKIYCGGWNCIHSWLWVDPEWDPELKKTLNEATPIVEMEEDYLNISVPE